MPLSRYTSIDDKRRHFPQFDAPRRKSRLCISSILVFATRTFYLAPVDIDGIMILDGCNTFHVHLFVSCLEHGTSVLHGFCLDVELLFDIAAHSLKRNHCLLLFLAPHP